MARGETYEQFVEKFKPKKTTDDCYTPEPVYKAVLDWACSEYKIDPQTVVRPFWPGGDYENEDYTGKVVIDNPPFSILSKICRFYRENGVKYFLFAPHLMLFSVNRGRENYVVTGAKVIYENGAIVNTDFVTNLGEHKIAVVPCLRNAILYADKSEKKRKPMYVLPRNVITTSRINRAAHSGSPIYVDDDEVEFIRALDEQKKIGKALYGDGFIISDSAYDRIYNRQNAMGGYTLFRSVQY